MAEQSMEDLKRTPLYEAHRALDARLVPFGGYAMPVQYADGIQAEHRRVRQAVGIFDISHMGEFRVRGRDAAAFVSYATTNDPTTLTPGRQAQYSCMCLEDGGIVDDLVIYRLDEEDFRLVVNAANIEKDFAHLEGLAGDFDAELADESEDVALIAVQGPEAEAVLAPLASVDTGEIGFYRFRTGSVAGAEGVISRTGYTGEDGFELYVDAGDAVDVWNELMETGRDAGIGPAGLGARDTLRLEMGYALYGHDIDEETTPLEARLGWLVKLEKGDFMGRDALRRQKEAGVERRLTGIRLTERGFPREGYDVVLDGETAGAVRSGTVSPSLGYGIATAYLPPAMEPGDPVGIRIRERQVAGEVASLPFYTEGSLKR